MSQDDRQPISTAELEAASDVIQELREEVRDELGSEPEDYRAGRFFSFDDEADDETGAVLPDGESD